MKSSLKNFLYTTLGIIIILIGWIIISSCISNNSMIFPDFIVTGKETIRLLGRSYTYKCIWKSVLRTVIGFAFSFVIALILGIIAGNVPAIKRVFSPFFSVLKTIPTASLVFLFLVLVGAKNAPILMVMLICLPILYEAIVRGFENIDTSIKDACDVDGVPFARKLFNVYLPVITPYIFVGIVSSFSLSFKIEIMSEVISGTTSEGLGSIISACQKSDPTNMVPIFAYSLIAIIIVAIFSLLLFFIEKKIKKTQNM